MTEPETEKTAPETGIEEIETLKKSLAEEKAKAERYLANWQRSEADLINYKRLSEQEKQETKQYGNATLMLNLLPFLDDMDRAFTTIPAEADEQEWLKGIRLVRHKLEVILEQQKLTPIKALGEPFNPHFHEAVAQGKGKDGVVVLEILKGYMFLERVLRPSKVIVGNGEEG